jgi:hypothetical protein
MIDPELAATADHILGVGKRRKRRRRQAAQPPVVNVTVNLPPDSRPRRRGVRKGLPGQRRSDVIANDRSRERRIGPSPG